jgi:hypothetical protein
VIECFPLASLLVLKTAVPIYELRAQEVEEDYKNNVVAALPRDLAAEPEFWNVLTSLRSVTDVTVVPISFGEAGIARQARTSEQNTLHE